MTRRLLPWLAALALGFPVAAQAQTSASPYGFSVEITLSPKARAKLASLKEEITVASFYYGDLSRKPTRAEIRAAEKEGRDPNQVELEGERVTISGAGGTAQMPGRSVSAKEAAALGSNPMKVNINVFSARRSHPDNLLSCDLFDDDLALARSKPIAVACKLIAES